jgi:Tfp pilus assembly protein PilF
MKRVKDGSMRFVAALIAMLSAQPATADRYQTNIRSAEEQKLDRARTLRRGDKYDESIRALQEVLRENPDYYLASYNLALAYADSGAYSRALEQFEHAERLQNRFGIKDPTLHNSYGWAQLLAGKYDSAEQTFKKAEAQFDLLTADSKRRLLNNIGILYQHKKDYAAADRYLKRAAEEYGSSLARDNLRTNELLQQQQAQQQVQRAQTQAQQPQLQQRQAIQR